tara:strand:- start:5769 stop:6515 length:747 start_codon:yes stop_codon:yes gene_type:complete
MSKYDFKDQDNYLKSFNCTIEIAFFKYSTLIEEFIVNISKLNKINLTTIFIKGFENIYHIFNILFLYSKNIDFTYHHTQRSYLYFCEFIDQIKDDNNMLLNLNIKDATIFIYKKIIYNINKKLTHKNISSIEQNNLSTLNKIILFYNSLLYNTLNTHDISSIEHTNKNIIKNIFKNNFDDIILHIDNLIIYNDIIFVRISQHEKIIQLFKLIIKHIKINNNTHPINSIQLNDINTLSNNKIIKKLFKI